MNLLKKLMTFAMGNGIVLLLGFISAPVITRIIDTENMGKFSMFTTVVSLLLLVLLLGIDQSYVRYYYDEAEENRGAFLKKCLKIPLLATMICSGILLVLYKPISIYLVKEESILIVLLLIVQLIASVFSRFSLLEIRMKQKAKLYSTLNVLLKLTYLIFIGALYTFFKSNYMTVVLATIMSTIVTNLVAIFIERGVWKSTNSEVKLKTNNREVLRYGIPFIFSMAVTWLFQFIDRISINAFCGYSEVGIYSGAFYIISLLNTLQGTFNTFWTPVAYERYSSKPEDTGFFSTINGIVSVVMLLTAIGIIALKDIIVLFLGPAYRSAVFIFPFLIFMPIMNCISETTVVGINFNKKTSNHIFISVISALFNLIGNLILVPRYGAKGAAISTGLAYIVFYLSRTLISLRYYKVNYNLKGFMLCTLATYILATYSSFNTFNIIVFALAIVAIITVVLCYKDIFILLIDKMKAIINKNKIKT